MAKLNTTEVCNLFDAIVSIKTREECERFLRDALTEKEISEVALRLKAARMLRGGSSYSEVRAETGMSTATVSRVNKALELGEGGYALVLSRICGVEEK
jgi:TrpR-related protein YerC/YecD